MPKIDDEELFKLIEDGHFTSITIDTNIFDQTQKGYKSIALVSLFELNKLGVSLVMSDVIASEIQAHRVKSHEEFLKKIAEAREIALEYGASEELMRGLDSLKREPKIISKEEQIAFF